MDRRTLVIRQGEVYWLHFGASEGSAPAGRRPALASPSESVHERDIPFTRHADDIVAIGQVKVPVSGLDQS